MKRVSFKVAESIKEAGYPQDKHNVGYVTEKCTDRFNVYHEGDLTDNASRMIKKISAPTYLDVWLWLWRCKKSCIGILFDEGDCAVEIWSNKSFLRDFESKFDPEEAIANAIDYLVENELIK